MLIALMVENPTAFLHEGEEQVVRVNFLRGSLVFREKGIVRDFVQHADVYNPDEECKVVGSNTCWPDFPHFCEDFIPADVIEIARDQYPPSASVHLFRV